MARTIQLTTDQETLIEEMVQAVVKQAPDCYQMKRAILFDADHRFSQVLFSFKSRIRRSIIAALNQRLKKHTAANRWKIRAKASYSVIVVIVLKARRKVQSAYRISRGCSVTEITIVKRLVKSLQQLTWPEESVVDKTITMTWDKSDIRLEEINAYQGHARHRLVEIAERLLNENASVRDALEIVLTSRYGNLTIYIRWFE